MGLVCLRMPGISRALGCGAYLSVRWEVGALCVEHLAGFCSLPSPPFCFPLCISVMGACLIKGMGAHGWVVRFCQPSVQSPSWRLFNVYLFD